jgi:hypothetical protein
MVQSIKQQSTFNLIKKVAALNHQIIFSALVAPGGSAGPPGHLFNLLCGQYVSGKAKPSVLVFYDVAAGGGSGPPEHQFN